MLILRAGAAPFSPRRILGLALWLEARFLTGLADGAAVATWPDRSGNAYDATQATAGNRPTYKAGILGGLPTVRFASASSQFLSLSGAGLSLAQNVGGLTLIAVYRHTDLAATQEPFFIGTAASNSKRFSVVSGTTLQTLISAKRLDADATSSFGTGAIAAATPYVASYRVDYTNAQAAIWLNGAVNQPQGSFLTAGSTSNTASAEITVGARGPGTECFNGDLAAILLWPRALTDGERRYIEYGLSRLYGLNYAG